MDEKRVARLKDSYQAFQADLEADLKALLDIQQRARKIEKAMSEIEGLLELEGATTSDDRPGQATRRPPPDLLDECTDLMQRNEEPIHIAELLEKLQKKGIRIPGRGNEANLLSRLHKADDRFVRTGRGTYYLKGKEFPEVPPQRTKKKKVLKRSRS
jgi:hypothetical protein